MFDGVSRLLLRIDLNVKTYIESVSVEISKTEVPQPAVMIGMEKESAPESSDSSTQNISVGTRGNYNSYDR